MFFGFWPGDDTLGDAAYEAGARLAGWDTTSFESKWSPTAAGLQQLKATAGRRVHESDTTLSEIRRETGASTWKS